MPTDSLLNIFPLNSLVVGRVTKVTEAGVSLVLTKDVTGYIPARELTWDHSEQARALAREGQRMETMVIGEDILRKHLVLSRRLALHNPWDTIVEDYPVGQVYVGSVSQMTEYGAFIELAPGVEGLAHISEIPQHGSTKLPIELWPDDKVLTQVLSVDAHHRRISLSVSEVIKRRDQLAAQRRLAGTPQGTPIREMLGIRADPLAMASPPWASTTSAIQNILLVDDDETFGTTTAAWLKELDYNPTYASTVDMARSLVQQQPYDLLLLDYDLPDGTGVDVASLAAEYQPKAQMVLLSAQADRQVCRRQAAIPRLICWSKPFVIQDFAELLNVLDEGQCAICQRQMERNALTMELMALHASQQFSLAPLEQLCAAELRQLMAATNAHAGLVCAVVTGSRHVQILAQEGEGLKIRDTELQTLMYSPVKEICVKREVVHTGDMFEQRARFRYMLPLGDFKSFLGIPIRTEMPEQQLGLLLFHRDKQYFTQFHQQHAIISSNFLGLKLERQNVLRTSLASQQTLLAGRLSLATAHEVQKQISAIGAQVELLNARLYKLRRMQDSVEYETLQELSLPELAVRLQRSVRAIGGLLTRQLDFARPYTLSNFNINDLVERTLHQVGPVAKQERMHVGHSFDPDMPTMRSAKLLIQQIFLNLAFNAVQQMAEAGLYQGELLVSTQYKADDPLPIRVIFTDSGPGIHAAHYSHLFQHGFTTRVSGTGQGLYISHAAAEALGGKLRLVESFVGFGSVFELALPLQAPEVAHG